MNTIICRPHEPFWGISAVQVQGMYSKRYQHTILQWEANEQAHKHSLSGGDGTAAPSKHIRVCHYLLDVTLQAFIFCAPCYVSHTYQW